MSAAEEGTLRVGGMRLLLIHQKAGMTNYRRNEEGLNRLTLTLPAKPAC